MNGNDSREREIRGELGSLLVAQKEGASGLSGSPGGIEQNGGQVQADLAPNSPRPTRKPEQKKNCNYKTGFDVGGRTLGGRKFSGGLRLFKTSSGCALEYPFVVGPITTHHEK